jgi:uncharacterized membrane protein
MKSCFMKPVYCFIAGSLVLVSQLAAAGGYTGNKGNELTALGNVPNWDLVVNNSTHQVTFTSEEGVVSYRYPATGPTLIRKANATIYSVPNKDHQLNVQMTERACLDKETGKSYETTVVVVFDGQSYQGCGNYAHKSHM